MVSDYLLSSLSFLSGSIVTFLHLLLGLYASVELSHRLFKDKPHHVKVPATLIIMFWLFGVLFGALATLSLLNNLITTAILLTLALISFAVSQNQIPRTIPVMAEWKNFPPLQKFATLSLCSILLIRLSKGMVAPPLSWDALTYHLYKAGMWVQQGRWFVDAAPDSWQFYQYFPPVGDSYWAWAMLGTHSDAWLAVAGVAVWLTAGAGVFSLCRSMDIENRVAYLATLAIISVPACLGFVTSAYVDNTAFALVMLASSLLIHAARENTSSVAAIGAVACALATAIKISFLPFFAVAMGLTLFLALHNKRPSALLLAIVGSATALYWQIYLLYIGKTPFYPAPFSFLDLQIDPGMAELNYHIYQTSVGTDYFSELSTSIGDFLWRTRDYLPTHLNLTWLFPLLLVAGSCGLIFTLPKCNRLTGLVIGGFFVAGLAVFVTFWTPATAYYRIVWADNMGRFFLPFYALLVILCLFLPLRKEPLLIVLLALNLFEAYPRGLGRLDVEAMAVGMLLIGLACTATILYYHKFRVISLLLAIACIVLTQQLRDVYRYRFYKGTGSTYDVFYIGASLPGSAAEILDRDEPLVVNFSGEYSGVAYRWFRYPFLGSRLQNKVVYVPPTVSGETWSKSVEPAKPVDKQLWKQRIAESNVDYLVFIQKFPVELNWVIDDRDDYELIQAAPDKSWALVKVRHY
jgi:hypothetical protein